jgi:hypothetical protein
LRFAELDFDSGKWVRGRLTLVILTAPSLGFFSIFERFPKQEMQ